MNKPKCSRVVYILLAVFLGALGIHNFVAGRYLFGVIQLILGTVGWLAMGLGPLAAWLWALVEAFTVKADGNGTPFNAGVAGSISHDSSASRAA